MPIKIEHLDYVYNPKTTFATNALRDICLTVDDGDYLGIIGHTGSGKSTLVSHLNALTRIQSGSIFVDGIDLTARKLDFKKLRSTVGMVFQYPEYQLFDETVERTWRSDRAISGLTKRKSRCAFGKRSRFAGSTSRRYAIVLRSISAAGRCAASRLRA